MDIDKEKAIRIIVQASVTAYAAGFSDRHIYLRRMIRKAQST